MSKISDNIKKTIKKYGYKTESVAYRMNMQRPHFSRLINNPHIRLEDIERIASVLDCDISELLGINQTKALNAQNSVINVISADRTDKCICPHCGKEIDISITIIKK